jgi:recombination protein RecA
MPSGRQRKLDALAARLQIRYGPRALHRAAIPAPAPVPHISTTFADLDIALGIGGLPRGRISEIIGPATSGKVTLAARVLAAAQREREAVVAWLDLGRTCDPDYLHRCGLDLDRLLVVRPADPVDALAITLHLVESQALAALVFDGLADLMGAGSAAVEPLLAGTLERLAAVVVRTETVVLFLAEPYSQYRTLAHVATVRLEIRRENWINLGHDVRGYEGHVQILKHKLGLAGASALIRITFNGEVHSDGR